MINRRHRSLDITRRFLSAMDSILSDRSNGKITAAGFGKVVNINSSNISRLRNLDGKNFVSLEACSIICEKYGVSAKWLLIGTGNMFYKEDTNTIESRLEALEKAIIKKKKG